MGSNSQTRLSSLPPPTAVVLQLPPDVVQPEPPAALSGCVPAGERRGLLHQPGSGLRGERHLHPGAWEAEHQHAVQPVPEHREREQVGHPEEIREDNIHKGQLNYAYSESEHLY